MNEQKKATPDHPIHELIANRWSPYAFADRPVSEDDLRSLRPRKWRSLSVGELVGELRLPTSLPNRVMKTAGVVTAEQF